MGNDLTSWTVEESLVYHLTQQTPSSDPVYLPQYTRDRFGYFRVRCLP